MEFGANSISAFAIPLFSVAAFLTDVAYGRIFNWLTIPAILLGLGFSTFHAGVLGPGGLITALLGVGAGLVLFGWLFALRAIGGGDVKFLMALGAWAGPMFAFEVALLSILLGGVLGIFQLLFKRKLADFWRRMHRFLLSIFVKELVVESPSLDRKLTMPFGVPLAIAAVWTLFARPLHTLTAGLGISLWS